MQLLGRERERAAIDRLVESARDGHGGALVVHGEPGVGKTALLDDVVEKAATLRVVRTAGVEGEMELPFAAVQQLCAPILAFAERLPRPQRDALDVAFGLRPGPAPNPFLVALAVLGLLSEAARERALLCVDRRRPVARSRVGTGPRVRGSPPCGRADRDRVRRARGGRRAAGAAGGPRRAARSSRLPRAPRVRPAGSAGRPGARAAHRRNAAAIRSRWWSCHTTWRRRRSPAASACRRQRRSTPGSNESFERRVAALPRDTRLLALVAASDPTGDAALVWRAARAARASRRRRPMPRSRAA